MTFLIYGASKGRGDGIGRSVARLLRDRGHGVHGLCRDEAKAREETGFPMEALDIGTPEGAGRLRGLVRELDPDVVWSACGTGHAEPVWEIGEGAVEETIEANVRRNIQFARICSASCLDGGPHLVLTGSVAGLEPAAGASVYAGTKGFVVSFVRGMVAEYARNGNRPKISLLSLPPMRGLGARVVADALEYLGAQSLSMEIHIRR